MPWLVRDGEVLASLEVADSGATAAGGCSGGTASRARSCCARHARCTPLGMRFDLDVAFCDGDLVVLETVRMRRWRLGRPRPGAGCVLEAEAGAFERWRLRPGDQLEVKGEP